MSNTVNIYVNKTDLGLDQVDNTSDLNKPISTATQTALDGKEDVSNKSTDTSLGTSDTLYPSQNAVKTYVDTAMSTPVTPTLDEVATAGNTTDTPLIIQNAVFTGTLASGQFQVQRQATGQGTSINCDGWVSINTTGYNKVEFKGTNLHADIVLEAPNKTAGTYTIATATDLTDKEDVTNKSTDVNLGTSDVLYPTQNAVKTYTDNILGNANALIYKGVIDCSANPNYPSANAGELYVVSVAGKIGGASGIDVEVGDMLICNTDSTVSGNQATVGAYWNAIQKNIEGYIIGPASSINNNVAFFDGVTGKLIKDSGLALSGNNTGDETQASIKTKLGAATTSVDGYLTSSDYNTFNNKQDKNVAFNRQTASYTLVSSDNNKLIEMNVGSANNVTINNSVFTAGNQILISQYGAGQTTITAGAGVTLRSSGGKLKTSAQYSLVTIIAISSSEFYVAGDLTA